MIFDSSDPTGGDADLGTPHRDFGGPGVGAGGAAGQAGENNLALGHVLIISEDNDSGDPDDNARGGTLHFRFGGAAVMHSIGILDFDSDETGGTVRLFDALIGGNLLDSFDIINMGNNSVQSIDLLATSGVRRVEVLFPSSGAITDVLLGSGPLDPAAADRTARDMETQSTNPSETEHIAANPCQPRYGGVSLLSSCQA